MQPNPSKVLETIHGPSGHRIQEAAGSGTSITYSQPGMSTGASAGLLTDHKLVRRQAGVQYCLPELWATIGTGLRLPRDRAEHRGAPQPFYIDISCWHQRLLSFQNNATLQERLTALLEPEILSGDNKCVEQRARSIVIACSSSSLGTYVRRATTCKMLSATPSFWSSHQFYTSRSCASCTTSQLWSARNRSSPSSSRPSSI